MVPQSENKGVMTLSVTDVGNRPKFRFFFENFKFENRNKKKKTET
jgi:hypothetical protein